MRGRFLRWCMSKAAAAFLGAGETRADVRAKDMRKTCADITPASYADALNMAQTLMASIAALPRAEPSGEAA
jgi:uncharacterized iron-regulated protein